MDYGQGDDVDPEFYLRMLGERHLSSGRRHDGMNPSLGPVASALVAVGLLDLTLAQQVVDDYAMAFALRQPDGAMHWSAQRAFRQQVQSDGGPPLEAPLIASCTLLEDDGDQPFPYAVLGSHSTEIHFTYEGTGDWSEAAKAFPKPQGFPNALSMADDTGRSLPANVFPNNQGSRWFGYFGTQQPLSPTTRWLELGGRRIEVHPVPPVSGVRTEPKPEQEPVVAYLRHLLAVTDNHMGLHQPGHPIIEAFVAVGALSPDHPVIAELEYLAAHVPPPGLHQARMMHMASSAFGMGAGMGAWPAPALPPGPPVPEQWSSIMRPTAEPGREFTKPLGAVVELEGAAAVFYALRSEGGHFTVDTLAAGSGPLDQFGDGLAVQASPELAWWAQDDRGQWYRGAWNGWSGGGGSRRGEVSYMPALDPGARTLRLLPEARHERAVVEIDLAPVSGVADGGRDA